MEELNEFDDNAKEAVQKFENYLSSGIGGFFDSEELLEIIDYFFSVEDIDKLKPAVSLAMELYPSNLEIVVRNAQYIAMTKNIKDAISYLKYYNEKFPNNNDIIFALGILYSQLGDSTNAIKLLEHCAKQDKEDIEIKSILAQELMSNFEYDKATSVFEKILLIEPTNESALQSFAFCAQYSNNIHNNTDFLKNLSLNNPYSVSNWFSYGLLLYYTENYFDSVTAFDFCIAIDEKHAASLIYKGQALINLNQLNDGITTLHEALKFSPKDPIIYFNLGQAYEKQNNWTTAAIYYKDSIKYDDYNYDAYMGVGMCYFELNDFSSAKPYVKKAIELDPSNVHYRLAYAEMLYKEGYVEQGEEIYQTLYDEGNDLSVVIVNWALIMADNGRVMDAIHLLKESLDKEDIEDNIQLHLALIELYARDSNLKKYVNDYLFQLLLKHDVDYETLKQNCPSVVNDEEFITLINHYLDENN